MPVKDMMGLRFDKLLVIGRANSLADGTAVWACRCNCGQTREIPGNSLRAGRRKSCGCSSPKFTAEQITTHGMSRTRTYKIWLGMRGRCSESATGKSRRNYFDRGIRVCERWENFERFLEDMGEAPEGLSIDRIDGDGNYEPGNCRWATPKEQANNVSTNSIVTFNGESKTVALWSAETGIKPNTLLYRLRRGMPPERALLSDPGHKGEQRAEMRRRECPICGTSFVPRKTQVDAGRGLYCSQACHGAARKR